MAKKQYEYSPPGQKWEKWKKENPFVEPDQPTRTTKVIKANEPYPFGPEVKRS